MKPLELSEKCEGYLQISIQDLLYGKMYPEHSAVIKEPISKQSLKRFAELKNQTFLFLDLRGGGNRQDSSWEMGTALHGGSITPNTGESPSVARESTLSQILEVNAPEKYYLSRKACEGIIRRAKKRGKVLPDLLREALEEAISLSHGPTAQEQA